MNKLFLIFIIINFNIFSMERERILIVTNNWDPYVSEDREDFGVLGGLIQEVFHRLNIEVEYRFYPWRRCEEMVRNNMAFGTFPYKKTETREKIYYFSESLGYSKGLLFYLKDNFPEGFFWETYLDLLTYNIAGVMGYWYEEPFNKYNLNVDYSSSEEIALRKLRAGRLSLLAGEELVIWNLIEKNFPEDKNKFSTSKVPLNKDELYLIVSKDNIVAKKILDKFNEKLREMKKSGEYEKIMNKK